MHDTRAPKIGLKKSAIIETDKTHYPYSRSVAAWLYENRSDLQGILWSSHQDDCGQAIVLFEPRLKKTPICVWHDGGHIAQGPALDELVNLLDAFGVGVVFG